MTATFAKPTVLVSRCLQFEDCRWNGEGQDCPLLDDLADHADLVPFCPEVDAGLSVPREHSRLVAGDGVLSVLQTPSGRDITAMVHEKIVETLGRQVFDGCILKSRSASCCPRNGLVYPAVGRCRAVRSDGVGLVGAVLADAYPGVPAEDEGRLTNFDIRHRFLTRLFASAALRRVGRMAELVAFHGRYKYLLMACHQHELKSLGRMVANHEGRPFAELMVDYGDGLRRALARTPRRGSVVNVLQHLFGYVSERMNGAERAFVLQAIERYQHGREPLSVPMTLLRSNVVRFEEPYLLGSSIFEPYPDELSDVQDSGSGPAV